MPNGRLMSVAEEWLNNCQDEHKKKEMLGLLLIDFLPELPELEKTCAELKVALEKAEGDEKEIHTFVEFGRARLAVTIREALLAEGKKMLEERTAATTAAREAFTRVARLVAALKAAKTIDEEWVVKKPAPLPLPAVANA